MFGKTMKQGKLVLIARIVCWLVFAVVLSVVLWVETNPWWSQFGCNDAGYKEHRLYVDNVYQIDNSTRGNSLSLFPIFGPFRNEAEGKALAARVEFFYQYIQCEVGIRLRSFPDEIQVARFSLPPGISFEAVDFDSYYLIWRKKLSAMGTKEWPALMLYGVAEVHRDLKLDPSDSPRVWQSKDAGITSYSEKISSLNVDWLKDENLDESQFMGLWHDGFLFRSKKEGSYIWIYAGI